MNRLPIHHSWHAIIRTWRAPFIHAALWTALLLIGLSVGGCGVKGPPVPPRRPSLPAVSDLAYRLVGESVVLSWRLNTPLDKVAAGQSEFVIQRCRNTFDAPLCENCPLIFETAATLPYTDTPELRFSITLPLEAGNHYRFKVQLKTGSVKGADSAMVQFDYPGDVPPAAKETP